MSNIFVVTENQAFFQRLEEALAGAGHQLTRLDTTYDLPDERGKPEKTVHLVVLDVDSSATWVLAMRRLTEGHGLKVVVASRHPTREEAVRALAYLQGGTALDYLDMKAPAAELRATIRRALAYEPP